MKRRGFTLVELLVVIGVVALLVGLLLPAIAGSWIRAREIASAANLRSIGQLVEVYAGRNAGRYPAPVPGRPYPSFTPDITVTMGHWQASDYWPGLFADTNPWWENERLYLARGAERFIEPPVITLPRPSFVYSGSFLGQPELWSGRPIEAGRLDAMARGVTQSLVRYPGAKALMWDWELAHLPGPPRHDASGNLLERTAVLFADQHVAPRVPAEATPGYYNQHPEASHPIENLHNTPDGVLGRDDP